MIKRQCLYTYKVIHGYTDSNKKDISKDQIIKAAIYRNLINKVEEFPIARSFDKLLAKFSKSNLRQIDS